MENKIHFRRHLILILGFFAVACAKVNFSSNNDPCIGNKNCTSILGANVYDYSVSMSTQPIDVLFVIDNSASMSPIQSSIGQKFPSLFSTLNQYDFHVGVTTTDISDSSLNPARAVNQSGALQDGKLIGLSDGSSFITSGSSNPQSLFATAITRPETLACEQYIQANCPMGCTNAAAYHAACPSEDTRAIDAAFMTLSTDQTGFMRSNAPLAVVIVSNADERASGGTAVNSQPLTQNDLPSALIAQAQTLNKPLSVYSVVIQPGDSACLAQQQYSSTLFGWYANQYQSLSQQTGGAVSSICSTDFSANLTSIGQGVAQSMQSITLKCEPINNTVTVTYPGSPAQTLTTSGADKTVLQLPTALTVGQSVRVKYSCASSN
jgi:hypothetical protein